MTPRFTRRQILGLLGMLCGFPGSQTTNAQDKLPETRQVGPNWFTDVGGTVTTFSYDISAPIKSFGKLGYRTTSVYDSANRLTKCIA